MQIKEKRWSKEFEKPIYEKWKKTKVYRFNPKTKKKIFSIDTPPPYVNRPVHVGQAATYVLMDMFARFKRMNGFEVLFPLGLDRNGIPIEMAVEKRFKVNLHETGREKFLKLCEKLLEESSNETIDSFLRLGVSFNSWTKGRNIGDIYYTDSEEYRKMTQETFIELWGHGLIYEDNRVNNYCPGCRTTIADSEIEYKEIPTMFNEIIFIVQGTGKKIIIGTTRPELLCTCAAVLFNPDDERYKYLEGRKAITPIFDKEVPIMAHPMADPERGTGLVMICSFGDQEDIRFFREKNLKPLIAINTDGTMNENAGIFSGMKINDARKKIIEMLKEQKLLVSQREIMHRTPVCERSKDPVEFINMKEFYLKQLEFKDKIKRISNHARFYSPKSKKILDDWIDSISIDWPISRRRYYATEIPLWYCEKCGTPVVGEKGKYHKPWKEKCPVKKCDNCGSKKFRGEERVFDTWFDSSSTVLFMLHWGSEFFKKHPVCSLRPQGKEIIRTWLYYTLLKSYLLTGRMIFDNVWINFHIVDDKGKKMSKSLGNIIDPHEIIEKYGAEAFRLWTSLEGNIVENDLRCSFERIKGISKTLTKLWNIGRFISLFEKPMNAQIKNDLDRWIINEMNNLIGLTVKSYSEYDFHTPVLSIRNFVWETFASHYIELVKCRAYQNDESALYTLHYCFETLLKLLAPVIPFITEKLYREIRGGEIHDERFPKPEKKYDIKFKTSDIVELNSMIWKMKKDKGASLKSEIPEISIPRKLAGISDDLRKAHNIKKIKIV